MSIKNSLYKVYEKTITNPFISPTATLAAKAIGVGAGGLMLLPFGISVASILAKQKASKRKAVELAARAAAQKAEIQNKIKNFGIKATAFVGGGLAPNLVSGGNTNQRKNELSNQNIGLPS